MNLLKSFIKDDVVAVGLSKFRDKDNKIIGRGPIELKLRKPIYKPSYSSNFFIM